MWLSTDNLAIERLDCREPDPDEIAVATRRRRGWNPLSRRRGRGGVVTSPDRCAGAGNRGDIKPLRAGVSDTRGDIGLGLRDIRRPSKTGGYLSA